MTDDNSSFTPPPHGGQLRKITEMFGELSPGYVDFSANLDPNGPPECVLETLRGAVLDRTVLREYPDLDLTNLRAALGRYVDVAPEHIVVANGMAPLLDATLRRLEVRKCLLPVPAFSEYRKTLANCGIEVCPILLRPDRDFKIEAEALLAALDEQRCDALLLANPQNPSGVLLTAGELLRLVEAIRARGAYALVDEAFIDYARRESITSYAPTIPGLVVFRSVTKFFGLAGLRVAYALMTPEMRDNIFYRLPAWPVGTLSALVVISAIGDERYRRRAVVQNEIEREHLADCLRQIGIRVYPGRANYLLLELRPQSYGMTTWEQLITRFGLVTRNCSNFEGLDARFLRVAIRSREDNARLVAALLSLSERGSTA